MNVPQIINAITRLRGNPRNVFHNFGPSAEIHDNEIFPELTDRIWIRTAIRIKLKDGKSVRSSDLIKSI